MKMTYNDELIFIDNAIKKILEHGQSMGVDGASLTRANLRDLQTRKNELISLIDIANRGSRFRMYGGVTK